MSFCVSGFFSPSFGNTQKNFPDGSVVKGPPANAKNVSSIPGSGGSSGKGNGNLLQYSCLGNPMNREPGRLQFMESQKSWAQLSNQNKNFMGKRDKEMSSFGTL